MWNRQELKKKGKEKYRYSYWIAVAASVLIGASYDENALSFSSNNFKMEITWIGALGVAGLLLRIFVWNPFKVGASRFFLNNTRHQGSKNDLIYGFKSNYLNIVYALFVTDLMIALLSLLLVFPGVMAAYKWRFVPYILAENPDMKSATIRSCSAIMMDGNKMNAFVLDLSFILWHLLGLITFGLVELFYVSPYQQATNVELYMVLKDKPVLTRPVIN